MTEKTVLYNGSCPICSREIAAYRRAATAQGLPLSFDDLTVTDVSEWGIDPATAAQRLHVRTASGVVSGLDAFRVIWADIPRLRWLAWLTGLPVLRPACVALYDYVLAPSLYRLHLRRERRRARS